MMKAVIFDMDGVISDTLNMHSVAESKVLQVHGINISPQDLVQEFNAVPDRDSFTIIFKRFNRPFNLQQVQDEKWAFFQELAKNQVPIIPGSLEFIDELIKNKLILGLASSAPSRAIDLVVETLKIKGKFGVIVGTEEVERGKPSPDIFLLAATRLKVDPRNCIVIEDAAKGIQAAKAAGMKCIAITTTHKKNELNKADMIVDRFEEIKMEELINL